jgi:TonB family protein
MGTEEKSPSLESKRLSGPSTCLAPSSPRLRSNIHAEIIALRVSFTDVKTATLIAIGLIFSSLPWALAIQNPSPTPSTTEIQKKPPMLRISSNVAHGLLIHQVNPAYPREAHKNHIQGDVILLVIIDKEGNVAKLKPLKGEPLLTDAAIEAVKQWKYKPFLLNGEPAYVETQIVISFHM